MRHVATDNSRPRVRDGLPAGVGLLGDMKGNLTGKITGRRLGMVESRVDQSMGQHLVVGADVVIIRRHIGFKIGLSFGALSQETGRRSKGHQGRVLIVRRTPEHTV